MRDVVAELTDAVSVKDFQGALKRWHQGALSLIHLNVLMHIRAHGAVTMTRLAEMLDVSVASATGIVDRMEKKGVVERRRNDEDRRVVEVHVTQHGEQVLDTMQSERRERLGQLLNDISTEELAALLTGLRAVRAARERMVAQSAEAEAPRQ
jgi:DNA-binding MarR family transcriptional regulator